MSFKSFRDWVVVLLFLVTGAISWQLYFRVYQQKDTVDIHLFPRTLGSWTAEDLPISDYDYSILETRNAFVRKYTDANGRVVYVFIVYSQNNRKVSHPPEICYTGSGATMVSKDRDTILSRSANKQIEVNRILIEKGTHKQLVFYWFKVGNDFTSSYWKQQSLISIKSFLGKPSSSALIRISADVNDENVADPARRMKEFAQLLLAELNQYLP